MVEKRERVITLHVLVHELSYELTSLINVDRVPDVHADLELLERTGYTLCSHFDREAHDHQPADAEYDGLCRVTGEGHCCSPFLAEFLDKVII